MRNKLIRMGVLAVGLIGLLGTTTPALATTQATATFTGNMTTSPIGYPCTPVGTTTNCLPTAPGPFFGYSFSSTACVGLKTDTGKFTKPGTTLGAAAYGPNCSIRAAGTAQGYCGSAKSITGTATITYSGPTGSKSITVNFLFVWTGNHLAITGAGQKTPGGPDGTLEGSADITPAPSFPGGPSCTNGTQTQFIVSGELSYTEAT